MKTDAVLTIGIALTALLACTVDSAHAQIVDTTLHKEISAGAGTFDLNETGPNETLSEGPATDPLPLGTDTLPIHVASHIASASAQVDGDIEYQLFDSELLASARVFHSSRVTNDTASAASGFDAVVQFEFDVSTQSEYRIVGWVSSSRPLLGPELISCQRNGVILAGDTRATPYPGGLQTFDETRTAFPNDPVTILCGAVASGGQTASGTVAWQFAVRLSDAGPTCTDPNGDGQTTASDALIALNAAVGLTDCELSACDVNDSGDNTASDSLGILTMAVGIPYAWDCPVSAG
jgi:hypothetical protein